MGHRLASPPDGLPWKLAGNSDEVTASQPTPRCCGEAEWEEGVPGGRGLSAGSGAEQTLTISYINNAGYTSATWRPACPNSSCHASQMGAVLAGNGPLPSAGVMK